MGYAGVMGFKRFTTLICLIVLGATLAGCTKCGWIWDDWTAQPKSCLTDVPTR
jgi:hypothetical protein